MRLIGPVFSVSQYREKKQKSGGKCPSVTLALANIDNKKRDESSAVLQALMGDF